MHPLSWRPCRSVVPAGLGCGTAVPRPVHDVSSGGRPTWSVPTRRCTVLVARRCSYGRRHFSADGQRTSIEPPLLFAAIASLHPGQNGARLKRSPRASEHCAGRPSDQPVAGAEPRPVPVHHVASRPEAGSRWTAIRLPICCARVTSGRAPPAQEAGNRRTRASGPDLASISDPEVELLFPSTSGMCQTRRHPPMTLRSSGS